MFGAVGEHDPIGDTVAIEDSPPGLASAVASGAATVGVPNAAELPEGEAVIGQ